MRWLCVHVCSMLRVPVVLAYHTDTEVFLERHGIPWAIRLLPWLVSHLLPTPTPPPPHQLCACVYGLPHLIQSVVWPQGEGLAGALATKSFTVSKTYRRKMQTTRQLHGR